MSSDSETKFVILIPDGAADSPITELGNRTPLQAARTPWMDRMAEAGTIGLARTVPDGMEAGSDVANLSIMGYSPAEIYTGRAPLEAASMGVDLNQHDLAFRLNLVKLDQNYTVMADHSADHISTAEAHVLVDALKPVLEPLGFALYPGVSYRHLLVWHNGPDGCITHAPHDFLGEPIGSRLPKGAGSDKMIRVILQSWKALESHPVNEDRLRRGQGPANSVWPWGQGKPPSMKTLTERFHITGSVVSAVDLLNGIGRYAGLEPIEVPGATGYLDTNYEGKVRAALSALKKGDFVFVHVEAPDETSHAGKVDLKIKAIEDFDQKVVGQILKGLGQFNHWRILLMPDHHTPLATRKHSSDPVPFILLDSEELSDDSKQSSHGFSEEAAATAGLFVDRADNLIEKLLQRKKS
jgi:2,3-bisphosphoglycerate-independent phosphoglycerate mutase